MFIDFSTGLPDGYPKCQFGRSLGGAAYINIIVAEAFRTYSTNRSYNII